MRIPTILLIAALALIAGCGDVIVFGHKIRQGHPSSEINPDQSAPAPSAPVAANSGSLPTPAKSPPVQELPSTIHPVKAVRLSLAPEAVVKLAGDSSFDALALQAEVIADLRARKLLDERSPNAFESAEIAIDQVTSRPTVNAVTFGYQMMAGTLTGRLHLIDASGNSLADYRITAESRWSVAVDGGDKNPLKALYHRFAVLLGDRLARAQAEPDAAGNSE